MDEIDDRVRIWRDPAAVLFPGESAPREVDEVDYVMDWAVGLIVRFSAVRDGKGWCLDVLACCMPDEDGGRVKRPEDVRPKTWRDEPPML